MQQNLYENYTPKNKEYINSNKELIIDEIMLEIIKAGVTPGYNDKKHFQIIQDKLYDSYMKFKNYDNNYNKIIKDYESSSGYDSGDNNARNKSMKKIEFDMVLRNVKGAKVNRYLSQEEIFKYIKSFEINNEEEYNLCFEVTISTGDVLIKKIPQVYKYAIWLNFLYGIFDIINGLAKVNKQGKDNIDDQKAFDELKKFFKSKFKFLDMTKKTIIIVVSNGKKEDFEDLKESLGNEQPELVDSLKNECKKYNLFFNFLPFNPEIKKEIENKIYGSGDVQKKEGDNKKPINMNEEMKRLMEEDKKKEYKMNKMNEEMKRLMEEDKKKEDKISKMNEEMKRLIEEDKKKEDKISKMNEEMKEDKMKMEKIYKKMESMEKKIKEMEQNMKANNEEKK